MLHESSKHAAHVAAPFFRRPGAGPVSANTLEGGSLAGEVHDRHKFVRIGVGPPRRTGNVAAYQEFCIGCRGQHSGRVGVALGEVEYLRFGPRGGRQAVGVKTAGRVETHDVHARCGELPHVISTQMIRHVHQPVVRFAVQMNGRPTVVRGHSGANRFAGRYFLDGDRSDHRPASRLTGDRHPASIHDYFISATGHAPRDIQFNGVENDHCVLFDQPGGRVEIRVAAFFDGQFNVNRFLVQASRCGRPR